MTRAWRAVAALALLTAACSVLLTAVLFVRVGNESSGTSDALCALRGDYETRVQTGTVFLAKHPHGIPGISAKVIREGLDNQQRTIHALRHLSC